MTLLFTFLKDKKLEVVVKKVFKENIKFKG